MAPGTTANLTSIKRWRESSRNGHLVPPPGGTFVALHYLIPEALLFDTFAFDYYWDELREDVLKLRATTGNEKF